MSKRQPTPDLSVILVSWNTKDLLLRCIDSVLEEQFRSGLLLETIVVDNASADGTPDALRERFPDVTLLEQPANLGFAAATNLGIEQSSGEAILVLNPDTQLLPGSLLTLWKTLQAGSHVGMAAPILLNSDRSFQSAGYRFPGIVQTALDLFPLHPRLIGSSLNGRFGPGDGRTPFQIDHPLGACMLVRRSVIDQVGTLDSGYFMYSEEIDWCRRISAARWTILCAPSAQVIHHGGQSTGQVPDRMRAQLHRSRARYLHRYHSEAFHSSLQMLIRVGITLRRVGIPIPTAGRSTEQLTALAEIYRDPGAEAVHD